MWGENNNYTNSIIWFVLLILIFFRCSSNNSINMPDYFRLTNGANDFLWPNRR